MISSFVFINRLTFIIFPLITPRGHCRFFASLFFSDSNTEEETELFKIDTDNEEFKGFSD